MSLKYWKMHKPFWGNKGFQGTPWRKLHLSFVKTVGVIIDIKLQYTISIISLKSLTYVHFTNINLIFFFIDNFLKEAIPPKMPKCFFSEYAIVLYIQFLFFNVYTEFNKMNDYAPLYIDTSNKHPHTLFVPRDVICFVLINKCKNKLPVSVCRFL